MAANGLPGTEAAGHDLHELGSAEALRQLELLVMGAPEELRLVRCRST